MKNRERTTPSIALIGLGGIGTPILSILPRLHPTHVDLWDDDTIGPENLTNQLWWSPEDIGMPKCLAAAAMLRTRGVQADPIGKRYVNEPLIDPIVICAVDSLQSRRTIWQGVRDSGKVQLFIDGRLSRDDPYYFQLFVIRTSNATSCADYEQFLVQEGLPDSGRRDLDQVSAPIVLSGIIAQVIVQWSRSDHRLPWQVVWDGVSMSLTSFDETLEGDLS